MTNNEVILFIKQSVDVNEYGDQIVTETEKMCFARVQSIGEREIYHSMAIGLRPEIKFIIEDYLDYDDEKIIEYTDFVGKTNRFNVIRTFRTNNELEIVCQRILEDANA